MKLYEESPDDEELVLIELSILVDTISFKHENLFQALQRVVKKFTSLGLLDEEGFTILLIS